MRNLELDFLGSFEDFRGASGNRFGFELNFFLFEGGVGGALGWTVDDPYFLWSEQHPADQANNDINDCSRIGGKCVANVCTIGNVGAACVTGPAGDASALSAGWKSQRTSVRCGLLRAVDSAQLHHRYPYRP